MDIYRPLGAALFFYECVRLLLLVVFLFIVPQEGSESLILPVYLSSNALFPLITLFVWLRSEEYRNYLTLYIAGKIIALVSFYAWMLFSSREFSGVENAARTMLLLGGAIFISLADILSVWGAWMIKNKFRQALVKPFESNGLTEKGGT